MDETKVSNPAAQAHDTLCGFATGPTVTPSRAALSGILFLSAAALTLQLAALASETTARHGDSLYTLVLGGNLLVGKGYGLDCIMTFPQKYLGGTWVQDCFRAPLGPIINAAIQFVAGKSVLWPHAASAAAMAFGLPLLVLRLSLLLFNDVRAAVIAAYASIANPLLLELSSSTCYDGYGILLTLAAILYILEGTRRPTLLPIAGLFWGLAYLTKESLLLPPALTLAICGILHFQRRIRLPRRFMAMSLAGVAIAVLAVLPWTTHCSGIPQDAKLTKSAVSSTCGFFTTTRNYCDKIPLWRIERRDPSLLDRFTGRSPGALAKTVAINLASTFDHLFFFVFVPGVSDLLSSSNLSCPYYGIPLDTILRCEKFINKDSTLYLENGLLAPASLAETTRLAMEGMTVRGVAETLASRTLPVSLLGLLAITGCIRLRRSPGVQLLLGISTGFALAFSVLTFPFIRYIALCYPLLTVIAGRYAAARWNRVAPASLVLLFLVGLTAHLVVYHTWQSPPPGSYDAKRKELKDDRVQVAVQLADRLPSNAVLMAPGVIFYHYYSGLSAVEFPFAPEGQDPEDVLIDYLTQYKVTHIVLPPDNFIEHALTAPARALARSGDSPFRKLEDVGGCALLAVDQDALAALAAQRY